MELSTQNYIIILSIPNFKETQTQTNAPKLRAYEKWSLKLVLYLIGHRTNEITESWELRQRDCDCGLGYLVWKKKIPMHMQPKPNPALGFCEPPLPFFVSQSSASIRDIRYAAIHYSFLVSKVPLYSFVWCLVFYSAFRGSSSKLGNKYSEHDCGHTYLSGRYVAFFGWLIVLYWWHLENKSDWAERHGYGSSCIPWCATHSYSSHQQPHPAESSLLNHNSKQYFASTKQKAQFNLN
jgi:hypothetical protein